MFGLHHPRPIKSLEDNLGNMDAQYEMLNEHWAVGEHLDEKASKTFCPQFWFNNLHELKSFMCLNWGGGPKLRRRWRKQAWCSILRSALMKEKCKQNYPMCCEQAQFALYKIRSLHMIPYVVPWNLSKCSQVFACIGCWAQSSVSTSGGLDQTAWWVTTFIFNFHYRSGKKFFQKTKPEPNLETGEPHPEPKRKAADVPKGSKPAKKAKKSKKWNALVILTCKVPCHDDRFKTCCFRMWAEDVSSPQSAFDMFAIGHGDAINFGM